MDINALVQALQTLNAEDAFRPRLSVDQWRLIAPYLTRHDIRAGDLLIKQGDSDRSMYFLGQGSLQVFVTGGPPGSNRIAILRAGSVIGEPALFLDGPRRAHTMHGVIASTLAMRAASLNRPGSPTTEPARRIAMRLLPGGPPVTKTCSEPWPRKYMLRSESPCLISRSPARMSWRVRYGAIRRH